VSAATDVLRTGTEVAEPDGITPNTTAGPDRPAASPRIRTGSGDDSPARSGQGTTARSWPLLILAVPAAVAVWSGWVGIGQLTGFGQIRPLPGIWDSLHLDTAVTLPIGVEAYAAYALRAWLAH